VSQAWDWTPETRAALAGFLRERGLGAGPVTTRRIGDGHSNLTFLVRAGDQQLVVRRPPPPPTPPGANDVLREARIIGTLGRTGVPVPAILAVAQAGEILDVPCYAMSYAKGPVVTTSTPPPLATKQARQEIGEGLIDTLADLHAVDWSAVGLTGLGRPDGFNARHLRRIAAIVADPGGAPPPGFEAITDWLAASVPAESGATIVHGDFRLGNVVLAPDPPGRVAAVLDWELATIGDPLLDVGYFLASVPEAAVPPTPTQELGAAMLEDGYPSRSELRNRYAKRTGRDLSALDWYTAMSLWKLAVLYEYSRRRSADPYYADPALVRSFLAAAHRAAGLKEPS
jgi:aminoglycoside phosphotransferase (APT) family kinase protein